MALKGAQAMSCWQRDVSCVAFICLVLGVGLVLFEGNTDCGLRAGGSLRKDRS